MTYSFVAEVTFKHVILAFLLLQLLLLNSAGNIMQIFTREEHVKKRIPQIPAK